MTSKNPFAAPSSAPNSSPASHDWLGRILPNAKATFLRWECWRLVYCAACVSATIMTMYQFDKFPTSFLPAAPPAQSLNSWAEFIIAGLIANICFFAGPAVDTYLGWLGFKSRWVGWSLMILGTTFTVVVAFLVVAGYLF